MAKEDLHKVGIFLCAGMTAIMVGCTDSPITTRSSQTVGFSPTAIGSNPAVLTSGPVKTSSLSITQTPIITLTPTTPPDVEISQLQIATVKVIFGEIINHLTVPIIFEDQQSPFYFDLFDPILNQHFLGDADPIDRINMASTVPCVVYPGDPAYFAGGGSIYHQWFEQVVGNTTNKDKLQITYQSLGKPWPDWKENNSHDKVWDTAWHIDSKVLYFSFKHTPFIPVHGHNDYFWGSMGLFDKNNNLLGVADGGVDQTIDTGIDDNYWISLDYHTPGNGNLFEWNWAGLGMDVIKSRLDHIQIMLEILQGIDGICRKYVPTATPITS